MNKGPDSIGVLDFLLEFQNHPNFHPIIGNHDKLLLDSLHSLSFHQSLTEFSYLSSSLRMKYASFIQSLPYYISLDNYLLVHAGFNFESDSPFSDLEDMLTIRDFRYDSSIAKDKTIIHGHNPYSFEFIKNVVNHKDKIIPLDNGCVYAGKREGMGKLLCLELSTMNLIWQENCD